MSIFCRLSSYGFIHHRALNDFSALARAIDAARKYPKRVHVLEGDLCWNFERGRQDLYFRHPSWVVDSLEAGAIDRQRAAGSLVTLQDLLSRSGESVLAVIELKVGRGDWRAALDRAINLLESSFAGKYWIDGFSLSMLRHVKRHYPRVPVTLHTECVFGGRVLVGAPEWPPIRTMKISDLFEIDGIAIRWRFTDQFMATSARHVLQANKKLFVSRIHSLHEFELSREWGASGGYVHWDFDELMKIEDSLERGRMPRVHA